MATVRVLKNRISGDTGVACQLKYDKVTGKLNEVDTSGFADDEPELEDVPF